MEVEGAAEVAEGFTWRNVLGSYVHLHFGSCPQLATSLVERCRQLDLAAVTAAVGKAQKQVWVAVAALIACTLANLALVVSGFILSLERFTASSDK